MDNENLLRNYIRELIQHELKEDDLDEASTTATAGGEYDTPFAFIKKTSGNHKRHKAGYFGGHKHPNELGYTIAEDPELRGHSGLHGKKYFSESELKKDIIDNKIIVEGKKLFSINSHAIGKAKYSIDYYDGKSTHNDGSPFIGIDISKSKNELKLKSKKFIKSGYKMVNDVFSSLHRKELVDEFKNKIGGYDLFVGHLGNGITIADRNREEYGDYKRIAHISDPRYNKKINWHDKKVPSNVKHVIEKIAKDYWKNPKYGGTSQQDEIVGESTWTLLGKIKDKNHNIHIVTWDGNRKLRYTIDHASNAGRTTAVISIPNFISSKNGINSKLQKLVLKKLNLLSAESITESVTLNQIENEFKNFDWSWVMSDDSRTWKRGKQKQLKIKKLVDDYLKDNLIDKDKIIKLSRKIQPKSKTGHQVFDNKYWVSVDEQTLNENPIWPKSKLSDKFEFMLSQEFRKQKLGGVFYVVGYDLYRNKKKLFAINPDSDSINSIVNKVKQIYESILIKERTTAKTIHSWLKSLPENKWRKTYNVDARRISHFVNEGTDENMPESLRRRSENVSYDREREYAKRYLEYLEGLNESTTSAISNESWELKSYIDNNIKLEKHIKFPLIKNLIQKIKRGKYTKATAQKAFLYLVGVGAKEYVNKYGGSVNDMFSKKVQKELASDYVNNFELMYFVRKNHE